MVAGDKLIARHEVERLTWAGAQKHGGLGSSACWSYRSRQHTGMGKMERGGEGGFGDTDVAMGVIGIADGEQKGGGACSTGDGDDVAAMLRLREHEH